MAKGKDPQGDLARISRARAHLVAGRFDLALAELDALDGDPRAARVAGLLREEVLEKRRIYAPPEGLLDTVTTFHDDFVQVSAGGIVLNFHLENPALDARTLHRAVRRARRAVGRALGVRPDPIEVDVFDSPSEFDERMGKQAGRERPEWAAGLADGRIRVSAASPHAPEPQHLQALLAHEVAHLAVRQLGCGRCPRWLDEGIAMQFSHGLSDRYRAVLGEAVRKERFLPLALLSGQFETIRSENLVRLAYAQSSTTVTFLVERHGWEGVRRLVGDIGWRGYPAALAAAALDEYRIEREWASWARTRV